MAMSQGYDASMRSGGGRSQTGAFRSGLVLLALLCLVGIAIGIGFRQFGSGPLGFISQTATGHFFGDQELPWFALCLAITVYVGWAMSRPLPPGIDRWVDRHIPDTVRPTRHKLAIAAAVLIVTTLGALFLYHGAEPFAGERVVAFQAGIFREGTLFAPAPEEWAGFAAGLNPTLALYDAESGHWVAADGPVFAAVRAAFEWISLGPLTNALISALSVVLMAGIARRLWPDTIEVPILAAGLLATSPQFLVTGMSGSALSAQLCLNLLWLWLFLRDDRLGHLAAALVGVLAAGLQQIHVHAVFVLPFLALLLRDRRWLLLGLYAAAYGLGHLAWLNWQDIATALTDGSGIEPVLAAAIGTNSGGPPAFAVPTAAAAAETGLNLLRLLGWMNLIVIPLVVVALRPWSRVPSTFRLLAIGILIALLSGLFLSPGRQEGWGYGHLHGHLGSFVLLAAFGWVRLASSKPHLRPDLNRAVGLCCAAMLLVAMPLRAFQVERVTASVAASAHLVEGTESEIVLVDLPGIWFGPSLVRNDPFLQHRPTVMALQMLTPDQIRALCDAYTIEVVDYHDLIPLGVRPVAAQLAAGNAVSAPDRALRSIATGPRCISG